MRGEEGVPTNKRESTASAKKFHVKLRLTLYVLFTYNSTYFVEHGKIDKRKTYLLGARMDAIYPISAFQRKQQEVKEAAKRGLVRITEQGAGAYIFSSEEAYEKQLEEARAQGAYEARLHDAILAGRADIEAGRYRTDVNAVFEELREELADRWK